MFNFFKRLKAYAFPQKKFNKTGHFKRLDLLALEERVVPATFTVVNNLDSGTGSLRQAIIDANTTAGNDTIDFAFATGTSPYTITLASALPNIAATSTAGTLTINGLGANNLIIDANQGNFSVFTIATGGNLSISGVTVTGANAAGNGGAFNNSGALSVSNSTLSGNSAGTFGGAIFNYNGALSVSNSTLSGNNATYGGGISNKFGTITISNSTLSGNSATTSFGSGGSGGGIQSNGSLTVSNSTISGNSAAKHGGGIFNNSNLTISNSTLSGNSASSRGGGIYNSGNNLTLTNSTLSGNSAGTFGGGINNIGTLNIANTIIANSTSGGDFAGAGTVNLIGSSTSANNLVTQSGLSWATTKTSAEINLGPLQDNGGPTFTQALLLGSVAIAAGNSTISNASPVSGKDQRGVNRITSDIGAYSFGIQVTTTAASGAGSLDAAITLANNTPGNDDINFNLTGTSPYTITLAAALPTILDVSTAGTLTINGLGAKNLVVDANQGNFSIFNIAAGGNLNISGVNVTGVNSTNNGGAFNNFGYLAVSNSTIEGNTGLYGGGIFNLGTLVISGSTLSGNNANIGGAIFNSGSAIFLSISNSTFSNNHANFGGGIYNDKILTVINSTFSGNSASGQGGGGIRNNVTLNIANTIIANSIGGDYNGGGSIGTNTNNLVEDGSLSGATAVDPLLGPLQDNGGPTFTMALLPGSPAIAAGDSTISNASPVSGLDQRGINRTTSDIGAFSFGIQVNTISDAVGHTGTSLRDAITLANTTPGNDGISFNLTGSGPYTITLDGTLGALPAIVAANTNITGGTAGSVTINGLGDSSLIISGNNGDANRNFNIFNIASGGNLFISGVTVSGANFTSGYGGAFNNSGTLTISNATLSGNTAIFGGGVYNAGSGILNISNSTVSGNSAGQGGAIANSGGTVIVTNSTVSGNSANQGGGIANIGTVAFTNSTLSDNTAIFGGGVFNDGGGILNFSNSTVSGNSAGQGGGIANNGGTVTVTNSTVSGNSANQGGGIANTGTLNIANTIIANSTSGGDYVSQGGTIGTNTNNLVEDGSLPGTSEITGDPLLGPLQNNGGPTFTQALLSGSPAIGAGSATISNASPVSGKDQRGFVRTTSDIGAYSYNFASAGDAVVSLDNSNQVVLTLSSSGATLSDVHTSFNSVNNTLTITAATSGNLIASPSGGIAGVTIDNVSAANTITLDLNTLANFAGLVIVGNSGTDSVTIGAGGVDLSAVATGAANLSFTANILGTSNSTSTLNLTNAIKTKGTNASTYLSAGTINGSGLITTPIITLAALSGIGATTALNLESQSIAADSSNGKIVINNSSASAVTVSSLTTKGTSNPSGDLITFSQSGGGTVTFNNVSTAGTNANSGYGVITLTNAGSGITVGGTGVTNAGSESNITLTTTGGGSIALNAPIDAGLNNGDVYLVSSGALSGTGLITAYACWLEAQAGLAANANASQGFRKISSPTGDISVTNQWGIAVPNAITATGNVALTSGQDIVLSNPITANGKTVTLTATGAVGGGEIHGGSLVTANTVDLNAAIGIGSTTAIDLAAFFVSADTTSGTININNTSGTAVSVTSLTTTGSDGITFNQTGLGGIGIDGPVSTGTGTIAITSQKGISGTGLITQANAAGSVTLNAGAGAILLTNAANNFTGAVSLSNTGANNVAITDTNALNFGASSLGSGTFAVNAVGITQSGAITQASSAGAVAFNSGTGVIALANASNDFTGAVTLNSTGATIAITDANALTLASPTLGANTGITAIAGTTLILPAFNFSTGTGNIDFQSVSGALATNGTLTTSSGTVSLKGSSNVTVGQSITTTSGAVSIIGAGIDISSGKTIDAGSSTITLDGNDGAINLTGALTTSNSTSAAIIIKDASTVSIGNITTGATGFVTLGGSATDNLTGAVTQTGVINAGTLLGNTAGDVTLSGANAISNLGAFTSTGTGGFSLGDLGGLTVTGNVSNISGPVSIVTTTSVLSIGADITATGQLLTLTGVGITQTTGTILAAGLTVNAGAGSISLNQANNNFTGAVSLNNSGANSVAITDTNAIDFGASNLGSGTLAVTAIGITQSGAITQASSAGASTFNAGAGVITLTNAGNDFTGSVSLNNSGANSVAITDTNAIDFGASSLGSGTLAVTAVGITQSGAITQASSAGTVTINAGAGVITLTNASNDFTGSVSLNNSGANNVGITDTNAIDFGALALGSGTLTVTAVGITQSGAMAVAGSSSFNAGAGVITLTNAGNDFTGTVSLINTGANNVAVVDANNITLGFSNFGTGSFAVAASNIKLNSNVATFNNSQTYTGNVVLAGNVVLDTTNNGTLPAGAAVTILGSVTSETLNFGLAIKGGTSGDVLVTGPIGMVGSGVAMGSLVIAGNDITLSDINGVVGNSNISASDGNDIGSVTLSGSVYRTTGALEISAGPRNSSNIVSNQLKFTGGAPGSTTLIRTDGGMIEFAGAIDLNQRNVTMDTTGSGVFSNGNDIFINDSLDGAATITLDAGTAGNISVNHLSGAIGAMTPLTEINLANAKQAIFARDISAGTVTLTDATDFIALYGILNITTGIVSTSQPYNLKLLGGSNSIAGVTTFLNTGNLQFGDSGTDTFTFVGGVLATAPAEITISANIEATNGVITLGDSDSQVKVVAGVVGGPSTGNITIGNVQIIGDGSSFRVGTGVANTIQVGSISGTAGGFSENVKINTTGPVTVTGAVGTDIGLLTITNSGGTTFQSSVAAGTATITNTTGTVAFQGDLNLGTSLVTAAQAYNISITGTNNTIAGQTNFLNTGTITLNNGSGDTTTFTGGLIVIDPSSLTLQGTVKTTNATMTLGDANSGVVLGANTTLDAGTGNINLDGTVTGSFGLTPTTYAPGNTTISGANTNTTTNVTTGVVQINSTTPQTTNFVVSGGTLKGTGTIGNLTATGNGIIAPGNSPGQFITNNVSFSSTNTLQVEIIGSNASPVAGTDYDQIVVGSTGAVNLGGATLNLSSTFTGNQGTVFTIIDNQDPTSAIQGTFAGLSEGAVVTVNGRAYQISYVGGTGNDVTLTVYDPATVTSFTPTAGKTGTSVVITGTNFTNVSQVSFNGTVQPTYTVNSPTQITTTIPSAATTGTISITTIAGTATSSSSITIDNTAPTLSISASPGSLKANETSTITFTFSEVVTGFSSSIITVTNGTITNPVASSNTVYTAVFTPTLGIKADGTIAVSNNYFDLVGNQGTAATLNPPIAINTVQTPLVTGGSSSTSGGASTVSLIDPNTGQQIGTAVPFPGFSGEIRVVSGDVNGDGRVDIIAGAGPGGGPAVAILDSQTGQPIASFFAYDPQFTGGVFVSARDVNNDGILDIITGAGAGGGPHVKVFDGSNLNAIRSFFAYDQSFTGGVTVAAIDLNGDNILDLVTGAGPGGGPHVKVFDGATNSIISQWFAYPISFTGGVYVAAGDIGNDGNIEVVTGAGSGGAPVVAVWDPYTGALLSQFMAYAEDFTGGVRVGVSDGNFDGILDLVTGAGPGGGPQVNGYNFPNLDLLFSFFSGDPANRDGVFVS